MQTSRFQLGLIATLAVGLGFSLSSSDAVGYPAGAVVSTGSNPVWNSAGEISAASVVVATAAGGDLIITDISISSYGGSSWGADFRLSDGIKVAAFRGSDLHTNHMEQQMSTGVRVPEGQSLSLEFSGASPRSNFVYSLAGYYAQP